MSSISNLRDNVNADIVSGIVSGDTSQFAPAGVAHVQTQTDCGFPSNSPGCGPGSFFKDYAYNLVIDDEAIDSHTFPHEFGHLLGGNHTRGESSSGGVLIDVINNGFSDPFAYVINGPFSPSLLQFSNPSLRVLYFSNPDVIYQGSPFGRNNLENNARVFNDLAPDMEDFEERPDLIFESDFE